MKKNLLFIFLLMIFIIPLKVNGQELYFNYGEYNYSDEFIEERKDLEVVEIIENNKTTYKYRTRDYLILPFDIVITNRDFTIDSVIDTNIPIEDLNIEIFYDLKTDNNCYGSFSIQYRGTKISKLVTIKIPYYLEIVDKIVIEHKDFDIWNYIDTDIEDKENINIIGEYNLDINGEYDLEITYKDISKKIKIIVNIEENNKIEEEVGDIPKDDNYEKIEDTKIDNPILEKKEIVPTTCVNNYYETTESCKEERIKYVDKIVPVSNKTTYKNTDFNKQFRYISYSFYGITTILLSIIVVRKK